MIKMVYAYKEESLINEFLFRQIREAKLEDTIHIGWTIDKNPMLVDRYNITKWHTVMFQDEDGDELLRIEEPFNFAELERGLFHARQILAKREEGLLL